LNNPQTGGQQLSIAMPELDVVGGCASRLEPEGFTDRERDGFSFGLTNLLGGLETPVAPMQQFMCLCCRQHKLTYVAQRFMWRPPRDAHKDGSITADQRHIIVE
jgi:hypothetical protein